MKTDYESLSGRELFKLIPKGVQENIKFRGEFHKLLSQSKDLQNWFLQCCRDYLPVMFDSLFCTLNPQKPPGESNQPFILRPKQVPAVEALDWCIKNRHDCGIKKSREEGATEIVAKTFSGHCILYENRSFIVGSREKTLVDFFGDDYTIFAKIDNVFQYLPSWLGFNYRCETNDEIYRKDMLIRVTRTNSVINGSTTNENFKAGGRATAILLDEFGRVEKRIADSIEGSVHDISKCVVYNSTHWFGKGHTFNQALEKPSTKVIVLNWYDNPEKNKFLYETPEPGVVELVDEQSYQQEYPNLFQYAEKN